MPPELSPEQQARLNKVQARFEAAEKMHARCRSKWEDLYKLYRVYQDQKQYLSQVSPGVDRVAELQSEWGSDLHIPYSFSNVETIVPRMLSNRPKGLIVPRDDKAVENADNMRWTLDAQQEQIRYPLIGQTTAKTGQIYGLGVQKVCWRRVEKRGARLAPGINFEWVKEPGSKWFDDPWAEDVDIFDFLWDPYADSISTCEWAIHRSWRSRRYVLSKLGFQPGGIRDPQPEWDLCPDLEREDIEALNGSSKYQEIYATRRDAAGYNQQAAEQGEIHEVWEFHDGDRVVTILDRCLPVRDIPNPAWHGDLPFHIYRPSEVPHEFPGIGAIEPARFLAYEMDLLRSQRRDMASLALTPAYAYQDGLIDPAHLRISPGSLIPVIGEPRDLLQRVQLGDVPQSGYMEEDRIRSDIERATGLGDLVMGAATANDGTATGAQLQLAAANVRIQNMTFRFENEVIEPVMNQWLELNQQYIMQRVPRPVETPMPGQPDRRWQWRVEQIGPEELMGQMHYRVMGGSTAPDNVPQDRSDAQLWMGMLGNPAFDQRAVAERVAAKLGERHPDAVLAPDNTVPPETLNVAMQLAQEHPELKIDPAALQQLLQASLDEARQMQQQQAQGGGQPQQGPQG